MSSPNDHKENALVLLGEKHYTITSIYSNTLQAKKKQKKTKRANGQHLPCDTSKSARSDRVVHIILCYCSAKKLT